MPEASPKILIVEDDLDVAEMLFAYFNVQGYDVQIANWGEEAVRVCQTNAPRLVILDIRLPDIDGFEVARRLRGNRRTATIPIIFLTEKRERSDRLQGLELGADDYITKPFDVQELRLRVRNALQRSRPGAVSNPVTNLPEGAQVDERLQDILGRAGWGVIVIHLENLDAFRELYGFVASDDVLRAISLMITNTTRDLGTASDFIGQLGVTDFVIVTQAANMKPLAERLQARIDQSIDYFYPLKDRSSKKLLNSRLGLHVQTLEAGSTSFKSLAEFKAWLAG